MSCTLRLDVLWLYVSICVREHVFLPLKPNMSWAVASAGFPVILFKWGLQILLNTKTRGWEECVHSSLWWSNQWQLLRLSMCVRPCGWVWVYLDGGVGLAIKWRMTGSNYSNALLCSVAGLRCQLRVIRPDMRWIATRQLSPSQVGWPTPLPPR